MSHTVFDLARLLALVVPLWAVLVFLVGLIFLLCVCLSVCILFFLFQLMFDLWSGNTAAAVCYTVLALGDITAYIRWFPDSRPYHYHINVQWKICNLTKENKLQHMHRNAFFRICGNQYQSMVGYVFVHKSFRDK